MAENEVKEQKTSKPFIKSHRRQRTGVRFGSVQDRIASFEGIQRSASRSAPADVQHAIQAIDRSQSTPAETPARRPADILPPIVFDMRAGKGQLNKFQPGDELRGNIVQQRIATLSLLQSGDDLDLEISNDELLDTRASQYSHMRSNTLARRAPRREISTAASILNEPKSHPPSHLTVDRPRTPSPTRLVPVHSRPHQFPSAFREICDGERPGSSHSTSSTSTISDAAPATPTSTSSWFSWALPLSPFAKRAPSPVHSPTAASPVHIKQAGSMALRPLQSDADEFGLAQRQGIQDHWGDTQCHPPPRPRTVSRKVKWEDEESVRWTWF